MVDEYEKVSLSEKPADKKAGIFHNKLIKITVIYSFYSRFELHFDLQISFGHKRFMKLYKDGLERVLEYFPDMSAYQLFLFLFCYYGYMGVATAVAGNIFYQYK